MKCPNCQLENEENAKFCVGCGTKLEAAAQQSAPEENVSEEISEAVEPATEEPSQDENEGTAGVEEAVKTEAETVVSPAPVINTQLNMEPPKKKKHTGAVIAAAVGAVAVVGIAAGVFLSMDRTDPKTAVFDGFKTVFADDSVRPVEEVFGFNDLYTNVLQNGGDYGMGLTLKKDNALGLSSMEGGGFKITEKSDLANMKGNVGLGIVYNGLDITDIQFYYDDTNIMAAMPDLFDTVFTLNYKDDLDKQIENSPFLGKAIAQSGVDMQVLKDYIEYCSKLAQSESPVPFDLAGFQERYKKESNSFKTLKDSIKVEKIKAKKEFKVDGAKQSCRGFDVVIGKEDLLDFMEDSSNFLLEDEELKAELTEYYNQVMNMSARMYPNSYLYDDPANMGEQMVNEMWDLMEEGSTELIKGLDECMDDEVNMTVYLDKKGRMVALEASTGLTNKDDSNAALSVKAEFNGGAYLTQNMTASLNVDVDGDESEFTFTKGGEYTKDALTCEIEFGAVVDTDNLGFTYSGNYDIAEGDYDLSVTGSMSDMGSFKASITGVIDDLEKGKAFRADADSIKISSNGRELMELTGFYSIAPLDGEIEPLEGEQMDILAATEEDWTNLVQSAYMKAFGLLSKFQQ